MVPKMASAIPKVSVPVAAASVADVADVVVIVVPVDFVAVDREVGTGPGGR